MKIKRFVDKDSRGAMAQARSALGPEAVILSNRRVGNQVELVAAIDLDEIARLAEASESTSASSASNLTVVGGESTLSGLQQELGNLKSMMESQLTVVTGPAVPAQEAAAIPPQSHATTLEQQLVELGLSRALSKRIADELPAKDGDENAWELALEDIARRLPFMPADSMVDNGGIVALLGTTGVGKTTSLAKLAARFVLRHGKDKLALVSTDCYRVGGQEQLQAFANYLDVPLFFATDARELRLVLDQLQHKKMVMIDTPGFGQRDPRLRAQLELLDACGYPIDAYATLPATGTQRALHEVVDTFREKSLAGVIVTKLDESVEPGGVLDIAIEHRLPLAYLGTGQKVPEDMVPAQPGILMDKVSQLTRDDPSRSLSQTLQDSLAAAINRAKT